MTDAAANERRVAEHAAAIERLAALLAQDAIARDQAGGHAAAARRHIRDSGLLASTAPVVLGGWGLCWRYFHRGLRRLAMVDSALAHVYAFHHLQLATLQLYGTQAQHQDLIVPTLRERLFWGNALNPSDRRALAFEDGEGFRFDGPKGYASGAVGADWLTVSAWHSASASFVVAVLPATRAGLHVEGDWDAFGQRQTDSGQVRLESVRVEPKEVLLRPAHTMSVRQTLRSQLAQLVLVNLYVGLAQGALAEGTRLTLDRGRPMVNAGGMLPQDDPLVQHRYGQLHLLLRPAEVLADKAARAIDEALARGDSLDADTRGAVAVAVAEAKVLAHRAALEISSQIFELIGPGATARRLGLDRFWRNARVHTLHDPVDHKLRDLGRHRLSGRWPEPGPYT